MHASNFEGSGSSLTKLCRVTCPYVWWVCRV